MIQLLLIPLKRIATLVDPQYAAYLDINHPENIEATLKMQQGTVLRLIVVTDAEAYSRYLTGVQMVLIFVGKLMVYVAGIRSFNEAFGH